MTKKIFYLLTLLMCSVLWNPASGETYWTYDLNARLVTNANDNDPELCQFSSDFKAGTNGSSAEGSYANLIDGNGVTFFTTGWNGAAPEPDNHPHWLQVDLKDQPQQRIIFTMGQRADDYGYGNRPIEMIVYASNDAEKWTEIDTIKNMPTAKDITDYTSDMIDLGDTYRYLRFAVTKTPGGGAVGNYPYFAIGEFQVYPAIESNSPLVALEYHYRKIKNELHLFVKGTDPGCVDAQKLEDLNQALLKAEQDIFDRNETSAATTKETLINAYNATVASKVDFKDGGYYYIISQYTGFATTQPDVKKALYADLDSRLYWSNLDEKNGKFAFIIRKLQDGNYTIQNVASSEYLRCVTDENGNFTDALDTQVSLSKEPDAKYEQIIKPLGWAQYNIYNTKNKRAYEAQGHANGAGIEGKICTWNTEANSTAAWSFKEITDKELIKSLIEQGPKRLLADNMKKAIDNTNSSRVKANDYSTMITSADQLASNTEAWGLPYLIDGNTETIYHSIWDESFKSGTTNTGIGWHNIQVNVGKEISKMKFRFNGRNNTDGWHDNPTHITLYGTNDDALWASTASADSSKWTEIVDMTQDEYGFPGNDNAVSYQSPIIDLKGSYKYLRFVVKHVSTMDGGNRKDGFANPSITGVTFNLSEFQVYDGTPSETSEYYKVSGMKEACDAYDKLVAEAQTKIANLTVTEADIEALMAAAKAIDDLYVDRDALDNKLAELTTKAKTLHEAVTGVGSKLITDVSQLSSNSNCGWWEDTLPYLIDGDNNTRYHSFWNAEMQKSNLTDAEWIAFMDNQGGLKSHFTGAGYHNLQVKLNEPVKSFYFEYYNNESIWHDNPNDIQIFATNDDELGASTDNADQASWTAITELNEGFPEDVAVTETPYTSPVIELGDSYKYIRFVVKNTTHAGKDPIRIFNSPDVTGITFNLTEFQMYPGDMTQDRIQYNYIPGMKEACDALKAIIDAAEKIGKHEMMTTEFNDKFEAAIAAVEALYADTTELAALANTYRNYIDKSVVSTDNYGLGYVDSEESINAFGNAITEAKSGVSPTSPTKEQINKAMTQLKEAFKTFMSHVGQLEPNKWYNIFGGSTYDYTKDQPIYLNSTSTGDQLHIGAYPVEADATIDPYSLWRLVPMEGQEPTGNAVGCYAIQNMGTGQYFGAYRGKGAEYSPLMSHEKTPYNIYYYGNGKFKMQQVGVEDPFDCLKTDKTNFIVLNYPADGGEQQSFIFKPTESEIVGITWYFDNSLNTMVLPWAVDGLAEYNSGISEATIKTYAVKSLTTTETGSRLELKEKSSFEAGEPFIIAVNDYTKCDNEKKQPVYFPTPATVTDTSAIVANGLIGTLQGMTVAAPGMGIFNYDAATTSWKLAASTANQFISGRYGYIDPKKVVNEEGETDLVLETADQVTAVKPFIVTKTTDKVNVYSIDGKLLKRNVKATDAQKGLKKGIYIIGKKKIAVK